MADVKEVKLNTVGPTGEYKPKPITTAVEVNILRGTNGSNNLQTNMDISCTVADIKDWIKSEIYVNQDVQNVMFRGVSQADATTIASLVAANRKISFMLSQRSLGSLESS